ncbi:MAG: cobalamin B12-binding domain-containing protein, partial [Pseudomonadota bacterium]
RDSPARGGARRLRLKAMTDHRDRIRSLLDAGATPTVESLAERAVAVLASKRANSGQVLSEKLVQDLIDSAGSDDPVHTLETIADIQRAGVPAREIIDYYIPEAARRLGDKWCEDELGFADVTISVARLQRALREIGVAPRQNASAGHRVASVLVTVVEGEFHTLGAMVLTEQFRRLGLSVRLLLGNEEFEAQRVVATGDFDAIFVSVGVAERLGVTRDLIADLRQVLPQATPIVVGGAIGISERDVKKRTGADFATNDPQEALRLCGLTISPQGARRRATSV